MIVDKPYKIRYPVPCGGPCGGYMEYIETVDLSLSVQDPPNYVDVFECKKCNRVVEY